jgi:hypothetical protein
MVNSKSCLPRIALFRLLFFLRFSPDGAGFSATVTFQF